jgi:hypothetical protein
MPDKDSKVRSAEALSTTMISHRPAGVRASTASMHWSV